MPALNVTPYILAARGHPARQEKALIFILSITAIVFFSGVMAISIHRAVMVAREERLKSANDHKSGSVFVKLGAWVWGGVVLLVWSFFAPFTKSFWKQTWADLKILFSPYSRLGVWVNAYTCSGCCNADADHHPELAAMANGIVAQEPKPNPTVAVTETPAPQRPAPAIVVDEV